MNCNILNWYPLFQFRERAVSKDSQLILHLPSQYQHHSQIVILPQKLALLETSEANI